MIELHLEREAFQLKLVDSKLTGETIHVRATNPESADGDPSTRDVRLNEDGTFVWTVPKGYVGDVDFTATDEDGNEETGTVHLDFS